MIPQSFIQDLLGRVDIVAVIERHVALKRAGANYTACCPFHTEKTPSFTVSQTKQFYHCFGCGAHGTAISFLMDYAGLGFREAVQELAGQVGLTVPEERSAQARVGQGADLYEILLQATRYFRDQLKQSEKAIAYLKNRGLTGETAARFGLGYAPGGWQNLSAAFASYQDPALVEAGLVIRGDDSKRYDRFRDRIMFPIVDGRGRVAGFGGRVIGEGEPKYLNSPETRVFEKGRELYGLYQARRAIRERGRVLVVEGYMDVVALAQAGVEYAVATLGTATTAHHAEKLLRQSDEVVFCFDGDAAGRRAAWRALEASLAKLSDGKRVSFLFLPEGEDPDSFVRGQGPEAFERLLGQALPASEYLVRELAAEAGLDTQEGRARLLERAKPLLAQVAAPALGLLLRKRVAEVSGLSLDELNSIIGIKALSQRPAVSGAPPARGGGTSRSRKLLRCLLLAPELAREITPPLALERGPDAQLIEELLEYVRGSPKVVGTAAVLERFRDGAADARLREVLDSVPADADFDVEAEFREILAQLAREQRQGRVRERLRELAAKGLAMSPEERSEYQALVREAGPG